MTSPAPTCCQFCQQANFKYTCPKCNALYCSVACYKSPDHLKCSEEFYKSCIQDELAANSDIQSREDMRKIYDILKRMHESEAGLEPDFADPLDSDDEKGECPDADDDDDEDDDGAGKNDTDDDIAVRLQDVDLNDADEVWQRLTVEERSEFKKLVDCGEIMKLLPSYKPWWIKTKMPKIVEITTNEKEKLADQATNIIPAIEADIPTFSTFCRKEPSQCLHYNLWNIMGSYACMVRYFNGEHITNPSEACAHLINLSLTLKFGTNFEDVDDAIVSVEMEALTATSKMAGDGSAVLSGSFAMSATPLVQVNRSDLELDSRSLMSSVRHKLAALSDIYRLMMAAKNLLKQEQVKKANAATATAPKDFQKLFAISNGSVELDRKKLSFLSKKIMFLLSYVKRENEDRLE